MNHTPGNWTVAINVIDLNQGAVDIAGKLDAENKKLRESNVDLLEALDELVRAVGRELLHGDGDDEDTAWETLKTLSEKLNKAQSAIAKAEGN